MFEKRRIYVISEIFRYCQTAKTEEFMFSNVVYRAAVYKTGVKVVFLSLMANPHFSWVGRKASHKKLYVSKMVLIVGWGGLESV